MQLSFFQRMAITADLRRKLYQSLAKVAAEGQPVFNAIEKMGVSFVRYKHPLGPLTVYLLLRLRGAGVSHPGARRRTLGSELIGVVPADEATMIQAGEARGDVAAGLRNAVDLIDAKRNMRKALVEALRKPIGYTLGVVALLIYLSTSLLPAFSKSKPRETWPAGAQLLGTVADNAFVIAGGVVALLILIVGSIMWLLPRWVGPLRATLDRRVFPFTLIASLKGASFLTTLAGYISAGVPIVQAVENIGSTSTPYMKEQCRNFLDAMKSGKRPEAALCQLVIVPGKYHWIIGVYSMSTDTEVMYHSIADEIEENVLELLKSLFGSVVSNVMLAAIAFIAFWIYASMADIAMSSTPTF